MSIFSALFKRSAAQNVVYVPVDNLGSLGADLFPLSLSREGALACGAVYSCVRVLADGIAQLPCNLKRRSGNRTEDARDLSLYSVLNVEPMPSASSYTFWRWFVSCMLIRGAGFAFVIRTASGRDVARLVPIHPDRVLQIVQASDGRLLFQITRKDGETRWYPQEDVLYVPYALGESVTDPVGPLHYAKTPVCLANVAEQYMFNHVRNDGKPNGYWSVDGRIQSQESHQRLKQQLADAVSGDHSGSTPLVEEGITFKPVSMSAVDMQMIDQRRYTVEDICGRFGVPPHKIGDTTQAKGWSTLEQQQSEFVTESLAPLCIRIEKEINRQLIPRSEWGTTFVKFNFNALLRGDSTTRANFYARLFQLGALSPNEIREKEDLNPIEGGDEFYRPLNLTNLDGENE